MATTKRSSAAKRAPAKKKRAPAKRKASTRATSNQSSTIKKVTNTAKRPAIAVGAAAAAVAGGLVLRNRTRRKTVLGVKVPDLSGIDAKSVAKTVGQASKRFARTSKNVSKDLDRAGDQAERIGKILD